MCVYIHLKTIYSFKYIYKMYYDINDVIYNIKFIYKFRMITSSLV